MTRENRLLIVCGSPGVVNRRRYEAIRSAKSGTAVKIERVAQTTKPTKKSHIHKPALRKASLVKAKAPST